MLTIKLKISMPKERRRDKLERFKGRGKSYKLTRSSFTSRWKELKDKDSNLRPL